MAVGVAINSDERQYNGRITCFVLLSCMVAASGGFIFGYDVGVSELDKKMHQYGASDKMDCLNELRQARFQLAEMEEADRNEILMNMYLILRGDCWLKRDSWHLLEDLFYSRSS